MHNQLSPDSRMLAAVVAAQRGQFMAIAKAWLAAGATAFSIWADNTKLASWPKDINLDQPEMRAAIEMNGAFIGELHVHGYNDPASQTILNAEAGLVSRLARMEKEIKGMTARLIDTQDQLLAVYDLTEATRNHIDMSDLLRQLAFKTTQLGGTEGAFFLIQNPQKGSSRIEHFPHPLIDDEYIHHCLSRVRDSGQEILINLRDTDYGKVGLQNLLFVPIRVQNEINAALGLINKRDGDFLSPDTKLARVIAAHAGSRIEHLMLYQESLEQTKLQVEADLAQRVQLNLLPKSSPNIKGLDLWAGSRPASHVGGDFYDFVLPKDRPFTFAVGDVSGKGMPAALLMAMTRTVMRTKINISPNPTPELILRNCNAELYDDFTEVSMFATAFIGQYHPQKRLLLYANAGHSPVIYCPIGGDPILLEADGTALGVLPVSLAEDQCLTFKKGDVLVVATDGFNEANNSDDDLFGYSRLMRVIKHLSDKSAKRIVEGLYEAISNFSVGQPQSDDQTLVVIKGM